MYNDVHGAAFCCDPEYAYMNHSKIQDAYMSLKNTVQVMYGDMAAPTDRDHPFFNEQGKAPAVVFWEEYDVFKKERKSPLQRQQLGEAGDELDFPYVWECAKTMRGSHWWSRFGSHLPVLQKLAMRVLGAPVSSSASERNWSAYKHVISDTRTRLTSDRAKKLVYIYSNSRVLSKHKRNHTSEAFEWDETSIAWVNETFPWEKHESEEGEVFCDEHGVAVTRHVIQPGGQ